jgi:hypothetical protein
MSAKPNQREARFYKTVERFLRVRFGCFDTAQDTGTRYGRVDVVGIRDVGGRLGGEVEVVAVEVKGGNQASNTATGQALGYSVYAERCYLADLRPSTQPYSLEEIDIASRLGVGLLAIHSKGDPTEVLTSPLHTPLPRMRAEIIEKLGYSKCVACGSVFKQGEPGQWGKYVSRSIRKALDQEKGFVFWLDELNERRDVPHVYNYMRRYLCRDCVWNLYHELIPDGQTKQATRR